jgi:hypothetical protein
MHSLLVDREDFFTTVTVVNPAEEFLSAEWSIGFRNAGKDTFHHPYGYYIDLAVIRMRRPEGLY